VIKILDETARKAHTIMTHGLQFLKLYLIYCYDNQICFPIINTQFADADIEGSLC
jgi:hypothetical protein